MLAPVVEVVVGEHAVGGLRHRQLRVDVDDTAGVLAAPRPLAVNVLPEVAELALLLAHDEVGRIGVLREPLLAAHGAQLGQAGGKPLRFIMPLMYWISTTPWGFFGSPPLRRSSMM